MDYFVAASIASFPPLEQCLLKAIADLRLKDKRKWKIAMQAYAAITDFEECLDTGMVYKRRDEFFADVRPQACKG